MGQWLGQRLKLQLKLSRGNIEWGHCRRESWPFGGAIDQIGIVVTLTAPIFLLQRLLIRFETLGKI
jgi:hypothetical protein